MSNRDPIRSVLGWYVERTFWFVLCCIAIATAEFLTELVLAYDLSLVDSILALKAVMIHDANMQTKFLLLHCSVEALLAMTSIYLSLGWWWTCRGRLDHHNRGSRLKD